MNIWVWPLVKTARVKVYMSLSTFGFALLWSDQLLDVLFGPFYISVTL